MDDDSDYLERSRDAITLNPFDLSNYEKAIRSARFNGDLDVLREFRNLCAEFCAVDDSFWLEYIEDERRYFGSTGKLKEELERLTNLFDSAVVNCPSAELWNNYTKFLLEVYFMDNQDVISINDIRNVYERSLDALGLHALDGPNLWASYRQFETTLLNSQLSSKNNVAAMEQVKRVRHLFLRQLELPLGGLPDLLDEYKVWEEDLPQEFKNSTTPAETAHRIGHLAWEARKGFEMRAQSEIDEIANPYALDQVWIQYINFEKSHFQFDEKGKIDKDSDTYKAWVARVSVIYHRCLEYLGFTRWDLWVEYFEFCLRYVPDQNKALSVAKRACRHMPRVLSLWMIYSQALVACKANLSEYTILITKANLALSNSSRISDVMLSAAEISSEVAEFFEKIYIKGELLHPDNVVGNGFLSVKINPSIPPVDNLQTFMALLLSYRVKDKNLFWSTLDTLLKNGLTCSKAWSSVARSLYLFAQNNAKDLPDIVKKLESAFGPDYPNFYNSFEPITPVEIASWAFRMGFFKLLESTKRLIDNKPVFTPYAFLDLFCIDFINFAKEINCPKTLQLARWMSGYCLQTNDSKTITCSQWVQMLRLKRHKRRRRLESESENSSDGSLAGSRSVRYMDQSSWYNNSPSISPILRSRSGSPETPSSCSPIQPLSPIIAPRQVEIVTRATWYGRESVEPSLAPAVVPPQDDSNPLDIKLPSPVIPEQANTNTSNKKNTLYVTNIVNDTTRLDIAKHVINFGCEGLVDIRLGKPRQGQQITFAYLEFMDSSYAKQAKTKLNKTLFASLPLVVQISNPKKGSCSFMPNTLFCSSFNIDIPLVKENQGKIKDEILKHIPNSIGVVNIRLVPNFDNPLEIKNYCYIDFATSEDASKSLSLNLIEQLDSTPAVLLSRSLYSEKSPSNNS